MLAVAACTQLARRQGMALTHVSTRVFLKEGPSQMLSRRGLDQRNKHGSDIVGCEAVNGLKTRPLLYRTSRALLQPASGSQVDSTRSIGDRAT